MSFLDGMQSLLLKSKSYVQCPQNFIPIGETQNIECLENIVPDILPASSLSSIPHWVRSSIEGEELDDSKERRCASLHCEAVFIRQKGESDASWSNKRYCSAQCFNGKPYYPTNSKGKVLQ